MEGVRTHIYIWPAHHVGAVILTNGEVSYSGVESAVRKALAQHLGIEPFTNLGFMQITPHSSSV